MKEQDKLRECAEDIVSEQQRWMDIRENGCNDPTWCDGYNMNLVRNHIIYDKMAIAEICSETGSMYPAEYFIPTPPKVDNYFMASLKQKDRVERLRQMRRITTKKCPEYNPKQLSLF